MSCKVQQSVCSDCVTYVKSRIKFNTFNTFNNVAKIDSIAKFILSFEGGFVNDPVDRGGATNKGVTIATWRMQGYDKDGDGDIDVDDLKLISDADAIEVMRRCFWKRWRADEIKSQNLANILVDWIWCSGTPSITITQAMLGLKADGIVGKNTLAALNRQDPQVFFNRLKARRKQFYERIVEKRPSQVRFLKGWLRRLDAIKYGSLTTGEGIVLKVKE